MLGRSDWLKLAPLVVAIVAFGAYGDALPGDRWLWTVSMLIAAMVGALIVVRGSRKAG